MMPSGFPQLVAELKRRKRRRRVAIAAAADTPTLEAALAAERDGLVTPILIGDASRIEADLAALGASGTGWRIIDVADPVAAVRQAVALVHAGEADFLMKGHIETADLMRVIVDRASKLRTGRIMSHLALVQIPSYHKLLAITDVALNTVPSFADKRQILENALEALAAMGIERPKVAVMAAAEHLNPKLSESVDAAEFKRLWLAGELAGCILEGPISYDLAIDRAAAAIKQYDSPVAGDADLMLVPTLVAGNLMVKALIFSAGAGFGGIIVGAKVPVVVTSRSAPASDRHLSIVLAAAACRESVDA